LAVASALGVPSLTLSSSFRRSSRDPAVRLRYDQDILRLLPRPLPDAIVLAGYMLVVSDHIHRTVPTINLHPALPGGPRGRYDEVLDQTIATRAPEGGAMVHFVTDQLDRGPTIAYSTFPIDDLWAAYPDQVSTVRSAIRRRQLDIELPLLVRALQALHPLGSDNANLDLSLQDAFVPRRYSSDDLAPYTREGTTAQ
jgi:folate-dependent phosphoribosylglycinamide formyltransferase PurN